MDNSSMITITFDPADLERLLARAKSYPGMHSDHCPHYTWYGGQCTCWVSEARKALTEHLARTEGGE